MKSRVSPRFKTRYRVSDWASYDRALVCRGDLTLWLSPDAVDSWKPLPSGRRGAQAKFSDLAIETALTLRLGFQLPLRQTEGFVRSVLRLMGLDLEAPDHTTLSRRGRCLEVDLHCAPASGPIHLVVESSGLSIVGEGEWVAAKHGGCGRRGWRKLHLGVDGGGWIVAAELTSGYKDDASVVPALLDQVGGPIERFTADSAYDTRPVYSTTEGRGAEVAIPPTKSALGRRKRSRVKGARDVTIACVQEVGLRRWKREFGYHQESRVENVFFRLKQAFGGRLRARRLEAQRVEATLACSVMNRFTALGMPDSRSIGA